MNANQKGNKGKTCKVCKQTIFKKSHAAIVAWVTEDTDGSDGGMNQIVNIDFNSCECLFIGSINKTCFFKSLRSESFNSYDCWGGIR